MKLLYNPSGLSHLRDAQCIQERSGQRTTRTSSEKMKIVDAVERMMELEKLDMNNASMMLRVSPSSVSRWMTNHEAPSSSSVENSLSLDKNPTRILANLPTNGG